MWYLVGIGDLPSFYLHTVGPLNMPADDSDAQALSEAREIAQKTGKELHFVIVSAHNDPENGPTVMRDVYRA